MAHQEQRDFCIKVKNKFPEYFKNKKVLDIGSLDINGSNRDLFEDCNYIGIDVGEGKNVDLVSVGHLFDGPDNYFDTIISTEVFEHDMFYEETIKNVMRMLKPGGLFLFTCAAPGRPEHGTRRQGEHCAPLLIQISEEWADYYKNLEEKDIRRIPSFNETFPDCYFEFNNIYLEIPADLYFYGIKGGEKYLTNNVITTLNRKDWLDHVFVIDCWPDNQSKEKDLLSLIKVLKTYNIDIVLSGHYPIKPEIQKMVDYYIFDKNNPLLYDYEFNDYGVASGRWTEINNYRISNSYEFHHDYAIWETMRNTFNFCKYLNKKYIHFFEYDNIPDEVQFRQSFMEKIPYHDAVLYEYTQGSIKDPHFSQYCATFIFSIKTDIALEVVKQINDKFEYFTNKPKGWQLERVFLNSLLNVTNNIKISEYIANNNELNTQAVWNRDGMNMNGAIFQSYLAVDDIGNLYLHLISGFHEKDAKKDYLVEVEYGDYKKFLLIRKKEYILEKLGQYTKGRTVKIYYQGTLVFKEFLGKNFQDFKKINYVYFKDKKSNYQPQININFVDGPFVEIKDDNECTYDVEFVNDKTNEIIYNTKIKNGWWTKASIKYYLDWKIKIKNDFGYNTEYKLDLKDKRVFICFESKSLGDNIAWIPYVNKFKEVHNCHVICSTFHNNLFKNQYKDIEFVEPGVTVNNINALYRIGLFLDENKNIRTEYHPNNPRPEPLTKIASDILGLEYEELKPKLPIFNSKKVKRVSIAIHSTAQAKYWNNPTGWQEVVDYLNDKGYEVRLLSKENDGYMGNKNPKKIVEQPQGNLENVLKTLQESELFIGISSGLSWLAWGANVPTILISGFTDDDLEPKNGISRIINKEVCHGCWSKYPFDPGDWNWCPEHKGTNRQFECSKTIKSSDVISKIDEILNIK